MNNGHTADATVKGPSPGPLSPKEAHGFESPIIP